MDQIQYTDYCLLSLKYRYKNKHSGIPKYRSGRRNISGTDYILYTMIVVKVNDISTRAFIFNITFNKAYENQNHRVKHKLLLGENHHIEMIPRRCIENKCGFFQGTFFVSNLIYIFVYLIDMFNTNALGYNL